MKIAQFGSQAEAGGTCLGYFVRSEILTQHWVIFQISQEWSHHWWWTNRWDQPHHMNNRKSIFRSKMDMMNMKTSKWIEDEITNEDRSNMKLKIVHKKRKICHSLVPCWLTERSRNNRICHCCNWFAEEDNWIHHSPLIFHSHDDDRWI